MGKKQLKLGVFLMGTGHHIASGSRIGLQPAGRKTSAISKEIAALA